MTTVGTDIPAFGRLLQLQTVFIVTAAVHRSLNPRLNSCEFHPRFLTYRHWAGVSPYTLPFGFAGTCVLDKQLPNTLLLWPHLRAKHESY